MNSELKKSAQNGLYEFAPDGNGCRIYHAEIPRYWYNYLWNEDRYCAHQPYLCGFCHKNIL